MIGACGDDDPAPADAPPGQPDAGGGQPDATGDLPIDPRLQDFADQIEAERVAGGVPAVAAILIEDGEVTFARGFGTKRIDGSGGAATAATLFRIGSVSKVLTATGLMQEVEAGRVALTDPITQHIPDFALADPTWAPSMLVEHLITHSTSIVDYTPLAVPPDQQLDSALSSYLTGPFESIGYLMAESGRMWNYANPNFALAGLVLERASGLGYREALGDRLFAPLGMTRTTFLAADVLADGDVAYGRSTDEFGATVEIEPDAYENAWMRPAGWAWSSVWDLSRFVQFLMDGDTAVLSDATRAEIGSPQRDMQTLLDLESYGYGLIIDEGFFLPSGWYATRLVSHGGDIPGFAASMYYLPDSGFGVIFLASRDGAHFIDSTVYALENLAPLPAPSTPPDLTVDPATFATFEGAYRDDFNVGDILITATGTSLEISMPAVDDAGIPYSPVLQPNGPGNFILTIQGFQLPVTFLLDESGQREYLRTRPFVGRAVTIMPSMPFTVDPVALTRAFRETGPLPSTTFRPFSH
jgi:CubicO group peptidase (beta-lactamase class C family)